jgi:hypothetical protein
MSELTDREAVDPLPPFPVTKVVLVIPWPPASLTGGARKTAAMTIEAPVIPLSQGEVVAEVLMGGVRRTGAMTTEALVIPVFPGRQEGSEWAKEGRTTAGGEES